MDELLNLIRQQVQVSKHHYVEGRYRDAMREWDRVLELIAEMQELIEDSQGGHDGQNS